MKTAVKSKIVNTKALIEQYQGILSPLDIHYLSLKCLGVKDKSAVNGRPSLNLIDNESLYHITFGISEEDSPYALQGQTITYDNEELPFRIDFTERIPVRIGRYHYFRHADYLTPTLDDEFVLNLCFQRQCFCCDFCQYELYRHMPNISPSEGFDRILNSGFSDFSRIDYIAIVTGLFGSEQKALNHVKEIIELASDNGFTGGIFYMGYEIESPKIIEQLVGFIHNHGLSGLRIAHTVESFSNRGRLMHGKKASETIEQIAGRLEKIKSVGVDFLEYTYIPGLDDLEDFYRGAEILAPYASPHICIFRPWKSGQREEQACSEYLEKGPSYLCDMRIYYEDLLGEGAYGNQLANLWPFPISRVDERWVKELIIGDKEYLRYWRGNLDPRKSCYKEGCEEICHFYQKYNLCIISEDYK